MTTPRSFGDEMGDSSDNLVGKSEMDMERELVQLIEKGNACEKKGEYEEAIAILEQAMKIAHYTGALKKKIDQIRKKLEESKAPLTASSSKENPSELKAHVDEMEELDKELMELSEELHQDVESSTPLSSIPTPPLPITTSPPQDMANNFGDLFDDSPSPAPAAPSHDLGDLFGDSPSPAPAAPSHDLGDLFDEEETPEDPQASSDDELEALLDSGIPEEPENIGTLENKKKATQEEIFTGIIGDEEEEEESLGTTGGILEEEEPLPPRRTPVPPAPAAFAAPAPPMAFPAPSAFASPAPPVQKSKSPTPSPMFPEFPQPAVSYPTSPALKAVILLFFFFSLCFLSIMAFCGWKIWEQKNVYDRGLQAFEKKNYKEALELIQEGSKAPFHFWVDLQRAKTFLLQCRLKESHSRFDDLLSHLDSISLEEKIGKLQGELNQFKKESPEAGKEDLEKLGDKLKAGQLWLKARELQKDKKYHAEGAILKEALSLVSGNKFFLERFRELETQWRKKIQVLCYGKLWSKVHQESQKFSDVFGEAGDIQGEVRQSKALSTIQQYLLDENPKEAAQFALRHLKTYFLDWKVRQFYQKKRAELKGTFLKLKNEKRYSEAMRALKILRDFTYSPLELKELDLEKGELEGKLKGQ